MKHTEFVDQRKRIEEAFRDRTRNLIIQGDNRLVLQRLQESHAEAVSCVYIDPPYNNLENWTHYGDRDSHTTWLSGVVECAKLLRPLLAPHGSMWVSIDDKEVHYLKVALDAVFGRENFVTTIIWQQRTTRENRKVVSNNHEYILVYAKAAAEFKKKRNDLPLDASVLARFANPDNDPRGPWQSVSANAQAGHATSAQFYELIAPNGKVHRAPNGRCWIYTKDRMADEVRANNIWFGRDGNGVPRVKKLLSETKRGLTPHTLWLADEVGTNDAAKKHMLSMFPGEQVFDTPKPEELVRRIFEIATDPGDLVLDAYLGSGTSAAVAQKIGRNYIGIEIGDHILSHCVERLKKVVLGQSGGVATQAAWNDGDQFDFFKLAS